jgi:quinol-cytochrome oxidoreductase complex cytochrome b subunit
VSKVFPSLTMEQTPMQGSNVLGAPVIPLLGSSIRRSASEKPVAGILLVTFVFRYMVMATWGTVAPKAVEIPPSQFRIRSLTNSVWPSLRTIPGTPALAVQKTGFVICALPLEATHRDANKKSATFCTEPSQLY